MATFEDAYMEIMVNEGAFSKALGTLGLAGALALSSAHKADAAQKHHKQHKHHPQISSTNQTNNYKAIDSAYAEKIVDAIYKLEGGSKTQHPYGVLSVKTSDPRRVCLNTVTNNYIRWQKAGSKGDYLDYLADVYCPFRADPIGNKNWHKNIHALVK